MDYYGNNDWRDYKPSDDYLAHHGILGMKWGIRRFQPYTTHPRKSGEGGKVIGEARKRMTEGLKRVAKAGARRTKAAIKSLPSRVVKIHNARKLKKAVARARAEEAERQKAIEKAVREKAMWDNLDKWNNRLSKINNYTNTVLNTVNNVENVRKKISAAQNKNAPKLSEQYVNNTLRELSGKRASELDKTDLLNRVAVAQSLERLEKVGGSSVGNLKFAGSNSYNQTGSSGQTGGNRTSNYSYGDRTYDVFFGREKGSDRVDTFYGRTSGNVNPKYSYGKDPSRSMSSKADIGKYRASSEDIDKDFNSYLKDIGSSPVSKTNTDVGSAAVREIMKKFREKRG